MICKKCGAPVPAGSSVCPYCGAPVEGGVTPPRQEEETVFSAADANEYTLGADEGTEFAGGGWTPRTDTAGAADEETEFAGTAPGYGAAPPPQAAAAPAPERDRRAKKPKKPKKPKKQKQPKEKPAGNGSPALRIVLVVILVLLLAVLIAKPYIAAFIENYLVASI